MPESQPVSAWRDIATAPPCRICGAPAGANHTEECAELRAMRAQAYPEILDQNGQPWWLKHISAKGV